MRILAIVLTGAILSNAAAADENDAYPRFDYGLGIEIENDWTFDSDDPAAEINNLFATVEGTAALKLNEGTGLWTTLVFEQVEDQDDDSVFDDHGLYVEELFAFASLGPVDIKVGKFNPNFGIAWDAAPGIFGADFAEDYELTERIGVGAGYGFAAAGGEHEVNAAAFFADITGLSDSLFTRRGYLDGDDGGPSNTESLESVAMELAGSFSDTGYAIGLRRQAGGDGDPGDDLGVSFGLTHAVEIGEDRSVELLGEIAWFDEFDAGTEDATYLTFGAAYGQGPLSVSGVYSFRDVATDDHLLTAALEYEVFENASVGIAYRFGDEGDVDSHTIGLLAGYEFGGGVALGR